MPACRRLSRSGLSGRVIAFLLIWATAGSPAARADDQLPPDVLKKVKDATVYIRVTLPSGKVISGSGFFTGAANTIVTNGHVLGMLSPDGRAPKKIEVVINGGSKDEKTFPAKIAQVDFDADLAVIFVNGKGFPEHLKLAAAKGLVETQGLYVVGFPFGEKLNRSVSIRKTSVSSVRRDKADNIQDIQVEGGVDHGNSGGPVIDSKGQVVGVAASGVGGTQINFAIPAETVSNFLVGHYHSRLAMAPYIENGQLKMPIVLKMADPLQRIKSVSMETWTGRPEEQKRSWSPKDGGQVLPGDSPHTKVEFAYNNVAHEALGEVILPEMPKDMVFWMQISYTHKTGTTVARSPVKFLSKLRPVERKPATIVYEHHPGSTNKLRLTTITDLKLRQISGADIHIVYEMLAEMDESIFGKPNADGSATGAVSFTKLELKKSVDKVIRPLPPELLRILKMVTQARALTNVDKQGDMRVDQIAITRVTPQAKAILTDYVDDVMMSLEAATVPVPGKEVTYDKPWKATRKIKLGAGDANEPAVADVTFTYHGMRPAANEAVVFLKGIVRGKDGSDSSVGGTLSGTAVFDLKNKQVKYTDVTLNIDLDLGPLQANGTMKIALNRVPADQGKSK